MFRRNHRRTLCFTVWVSLAYFGTYFQAIQVFRYSCRGYSVFVCLLVLGITSTLQLEHVTWVLGPAH